MSISSRFKKKDIYRISNGNYRFNLKESFLNSYSEFFISFEERIPKVNEQVEMTYHQHLELTASDSERGEE